MLAQRVRPVINLKTIMRRLFKNPSIVVLGGTWKTGKTDMGLWISELLFKYGLIDLCASNINTLGHYEQITDLLTLNQWLYSCKKRKLYIFDEASEHIPCSRSQSTKSVGIKRLIPQVSKAHGRLLVIGHNLDKLDKELLSETWCKGIIQKTGQPFQCKNAIVISPLLPKVFKLYEIPPTQIKFDPYDLAPFTERPGATVYFKDEDKALLWQWANGTGFKELGLHGMQLNRKVRLFVKRALENELHSSHILGGGSTPDPGVK